MLLVGVHIEQCSMCMNSGTDEPCGTAQQREMVTPMMGLVEGYINTEMRFMLTKQKSRQKETRFSLHRVISFVYLLMGLRVHKEHDSQESGFCEYQHRPTLHNLTLMV
jgi:hypothetical protein